MDAFEDVTEESLGVLKDWIKIIDFISRGPRHFPQYHVVSRLGKKPPTITSSYLLVRFDFAITISDAILINQFSWTYLLGHKTIGCRQSYDDVMLVILGSLSFECLKRYVKVTKIKGI